MKLTKQSIIFTIGLLSFSSGAWSGVTEGDWKNLHDNDLIVDTTYQRVFLDLNYTDGMSISQVSDRLQSEFQGWRLATAQEVGELYASLLNIPYSDASHQGTAFSSRQDLTKIFGITDSYRNLYNDVYESSYGLFMGSDGFAYSMGIQEQSEYYAHYNHPRGDIYSPQSDYGVFITPDENNLTLFQQNNTEYNTISDVSSPIALSALSLILFGGLRRKCTKLIKT